MDVMHFYYLLWLLLLFVLSVVVCDGDDILLSTEKLISQPDVLTALTNPKQIPRLVFRKAETNYTSLPEAFKEIMRNTTRLNPKYSQFYFSSLDTALFIQQYFPQYWSDYKTVVPGAFRADIFRLLVLYQFGGIYVDMSMIFKRPIDEVVTATDEFVSIKNHDNWGMQNSFISCYPKHPLMLRMIEHVMKNFHEQNYGDSVIGITGTATVCFYFVLYSVLAHHCWYILFNVVRL